MRLLLLHVAQILWNCCRYHAFAVAKKMENQIWDQSQKKRMLIINGNAFYEIDLECVKKKKQCAQTVHPEKKTDRINSRNMKYKDNIRQHE